MVLLRSEHIHVNYGLGIIHATLLRCEKVICAVECLPKIGVHDEAFNPLPCYGRKSNGSYLYGNLSVLDFISHS